ncbi:MAG: nucleotide sugar dehydrogenase [Oligoflexia bacterium]|nr:nucleotide sugar dehydrogenase [Oligoflexia bacterium]
MRASVIGLGKLGASMAAAIASRGFQVVGVDVLKSNVEALNNGQAPVAETGLAAMVAAHKQRIKATTSHREAVLNSDISFCIVPTPSDERGAFSLQYASWAFKEMGAALREKKDYHLIVLTSTVLPGSCRYGLIPILEEASGKKCGKDFGFCYSPEFIALGSIIEDFLNPDFTLVGEFDERSGATLEEAYRGIVANGAPCQRMTLENAELAKVALNSFVTMKITFANVLADICEHLPGGDVDRVTNAIGLDQRIGQQYLKGGLGFGGPCFPRDNVAFRFIAQALGSESRISRTTVEINHSVAEKMIERLRPYAARNATVAFLGLAYKPFTQVVEESQSVTIADAISKAGARVVAYDPLANESARTQLSGTIVFAQSVKEALSGADVVVISTADPEFKALKASDFKNGNRKVTVIDCWRLLDQELTGCKWVEYLPLGRATESDASVDVLRGLWESKRPDQPNA